MLSEERKLDYVNTIKKICLMDDVFMNAVFGDNLELTADLLKVILENDKINVVSSKAQYSIKNIAGHSAMLDIFAKDDQGRNFNVEIQRLDGGAVPQRARYYVGLIDSKFFPSGEQYADIKDTYVIFITEHDVLGYGLPIYHIDRHIRENGAAFDDGAYIVYVNGEKRTEHTPLGRLMHDFFCRDAKDMYNKKLAARVSYLKDDQGGVKVMCELMQKLFDKEAEEIKHNERRQYAEVMLKDGVSLENAIKWSKLSREEVEAIAKQLKEKPVA